MFILSSTLIIVIYIIFCNTNQFMIFKGGGRNFSVLMALLQFPAFLLVEVRLREGKALGSEAGKVLGYGICYEQRREVEQGLCCI
jgi:hypothetical protein